VQEPRPTVKLARGTWVHYLNAAHSTLIKAGTTTRAKISTHDVQQLPPFRAPNDVFRYTT
jgi:hypothetical protein